MNKKVFIPLFVMFIGCISFNNFTIYISNNIVKGKPANSAFNDNSFYQCVVDSYNSEFGENLSSSISLSGKQLKLITKIDCSNKKYNEIKSTKGLELLTFLTDLIITEKKITSLDISKNTALKKLDIYKNKIISLDVSKNTALTLLDVSQNHLDKLDVSKNTALTTLNASNNYLDKLDVSKNTALTTLNISYNQLNELNVKKNTALTKLNASKNKLTQLDVRKNTALTTLIINPIKSIMLPKLKEKFFYYKDKNNNDIVALEYLDISNSKADVLTFDASKRKTENFFSNTICDRALVSDTSKFVCDVNGDKKIDVGDAVAVLKYVTGKNNIADETKKLYDANYDGIINTGDAINILKYIINAIS